MEHLLNLVIVLTSGTFAQQCPLHLEVAEGCVPRTDRIRCYLPFQFGRS